MWIIQLQSYDAAVQVLHVTDPAPGAVVDSAKLLKDGCKGEVLFVEYDTVRQRLHASSYMYLVLACLEPCTRSWSTLVHWYR